MVSFLAKKKFEKIFNIENAGTPIAKKVRAMAVLITLVLSKEPYPNRDVIISCEAKTKAEEMGAKGNRLANLQVDAPEREREGGKSHRR